MSMKMFNGVFGNLGGALWTLIGYAKKVGGVVQVDLTGFLMQN